MLGSVLVRTLGDRRRALVIYAIAIVAVSAMYIGVFPSFQDQMEGYAEAMPEGLAAFMGNDFASPAGYLHSTLFTVLGPVLLVAAAVTWAASTIAGEEENRTLPLLLTVPLPRGRLAVQKWIAVLLGVTALAVVLFLAVQGMVLAAEMDVPTVDILAATAHLHGLAVVAAGLGLGVGAATGRRSLAIGVGAGVVVAGFVLSGVSGMVEGLQPLRWLSPFYWFNGHEPIRNGVHWGSLALLYGVGALTGALGIWRFRGRDLR